jgi:hypothetical protein
MSKYHDLFPDLEDKFLIAIAKADLENFVNIKILGLENQKEITKVAKATPLLKHLTTAEVIITVNELVFEQLEDLYQNIVIDETLARIYYDAEKGNVVLKKPDFETFSLVMQRYTCDVMLTEREVVRAIYSQSEGESDQLTNQ